MSDSKNQSLNSMPNAFDANFMAQERPRDFSQSVTLNNFQGKNETRKLSFMKPTNGQDLQFKGSLYNSNTPQNLLLPQVNFINEDQFKKNQDCFVCKVSFGNFKDRQHHCRLCGNSCCSLCSSRTINNNRVCDVCFLKATQITYEKKRRRYIKAVKDHIEKMQIHLKAGDEKLKDLDKEEIAQKQQIEEETEKLRKETDDLIIVQQNYEKEKLDLQQQLRNLQSLIEPKRQLQEKMQQQEHDTDQRLRQLDAEVFLKQQTLEEKKQQYEKLKNNLKELEKSESFCNLSHFQEAFNRDPNHISETLLAIDSAKKQQKRFNTQSFGNNNKQSFTSSTNSQHRAQQLYDPEFFDKKQLQEIMNTNASETTQKQHKVRKNEKNKKIDGEQTGCNEECQVF